MVAHCVNRFSCTSCYLKFIELRLVRYENGLLNWSSIHLNNCNGCTTVNLARKYYFLMVFSPSLAAGIKSKINMFIDLEVYATALIAITN